MNTAPLPLTSPNRGVDTSRSPLPSYTELLRRLAGQEHALRYWDTLSDHQRTTFAVQLLSLNLDELRQLYQRRHETSVLPAPERIGPVSVIPPDSKQHVERGIDALSRGEVAVLLVAGGQGSRLGFDAPKGFYPVGPLSRKSLFQLHAEKVLALQQRYGGRVFTLIMTSPATHGPTVAFFEHHRYFGLTPSDVAFFQQGTMPALCLETGKLLLETPGSLFLSPDGHGGTLTALASSGLLSRLRERGVRTVFYFQVDNPLVRIADPAFLGHHLAAQAEVSSKVVAKRNAVERAGVFATMDGRCVVIEYSDLPRSLAEETQADGRLRLWAGSPAIHAFDLEFLQRMTGEGCLPFHVARKKVPHVDDPSPVRENALKFERFIFDVLPRAERWLLMETRREEEFAPLKNASGDDSPATVRAALLADSARRLQQAGAEVVGEVEVSPLYRLEDFSGRQVSGYVE